MVSWSPDIYSRAFKYAALAHHGQRVTGTELPYITHISLVSMEVMAALSRTDGLDGDLAVQCALLHDALEDTPVTFGQLESKFGLPVARGVLALTKNSLLPQGQQMPDSLARIRQQPREVWLVKLADRITNLAPPPVHWNNEKKTSYRQEAILIHAALGDASSYLAGRLSERIEQYNAYIALL